MTDRKPTVNVVRCYGTMMVNCRHDHRSITAAQHCRRFQTRKWPAGRVTWPSIDETTYRLVVSR